jgi:hypothetical protein
VSVHLPFRRFRCFWGQTQLCASFRHVSLCELARSVKHALATRRFWFVWCSCIRT